MKSDKAKLRRYEDDLHVTGSGIIIMGAWSIIRLTIELFFGAREYFDLDTSDQFKYTLNITITAITVAILSFILMKLHLYIGMNAIKAAKGMEYKKGFFIAAIILLILYIPSFISYKDKFQEPDYIETTISSLLVDLTSLYMIIILIISAIKIKRLKNI